ncbi:MAG: hypothetical protein IPO37_09280 [Saprospiraceae bacterium]|nr:hypothetical protein [Saprospiraceae bacterium]
MLELLGYYAVSAGILPESIQKKDLNVKVYQIVVSEGRRELVKRKIKNCDKPLTMQAGSLVIGYRSGTLRQTGVKNIN